MKIPNPFGQKKERPAEIYQVEVIENRQGGYASWDTTAKIVRDSEAAIPQYDVAGIHRLIPVPDYSHTFMTSTGGKKIKFYSPEPDTYEIIKFVPEKRELGTTKDEYLKSWFNMKVKQAHERFTKLGGWDKWLPLIMLIVVALIFLIGIRFATESFQKSAEAGASMGTATVTKFAEVTEDWKEVTKSCKEIITLYRDIMAKNTDAIGAPLKPPA